MTYISHYAGEKLNSFVEIAMTDLLVKKTMYFRKDDKEAIIGFILGNYDELYIIELDCVELMKIAIKEATRHYESMYL